MTKNQNTFNLKNQKIDENLAVWLKPITLGEKILVLKKQMTYFSNAQNEPVRFACRTRNSCFARSEINST